MHCPGSWSGGERGSSPRESTGGRGDRGSRGTGGGSHQPAEPAHRRKGGDTQDGSGERGGRKRGARCLSPHLLALLRPLWPALVLSGLCGVPSAALDLRLDSALAPMMLANGAADTASAAGAGTRLVQSDTPGQTQDLAGALGLSMLKAAPPAVAPLHHRPPFPPKHHSPPRSTPAPLPYPPSGHPKSIGKAPPRSPPPRCRTPKLPPLNPQAVKAAEAAMAPCRQGCPSFPQNATSAQCQSQCAAGCCAYAWAARVPISTQDAQNCTVRTLSIVFGSCYNGSCDAETQDPTLSRLPLDQCTAVCGNFSSPSGLEGACISGPCDGNSSYTLYAVRSPSLTNADGAMIQAPGPVKSGNCTVNDCEPAAAPRTHRGYTWVLSVLLGSVAVAAVL